MGCGLNYGVNLAARMDRPPVAVQTLATEFITQSFARNRIICVKNFVDPSNGNNMVFNVKKLLNDGMDLTLR
jgi:hypothetical protein